MKTWIILAALATAACGKGPSKDQCEKALDHLVDLELKKAGTTQSAAVKADLAKQKAAVVEAKRAEFMTECIDKTAKDRVECVLGKQSIDDVALCDATPED